MRRYLWLAAASIIALIFVLTVIAHELSEVAEPTPTPLPTYTTLPTCTPYPTYTIPPPTATPRPTGWKGVGWTYHPDKCAAAQEMGIEWGYNWEPMTGGQCLGIEFIPARRSCEGICPPLAPSEYLIALNEPVTQLHKSAEWAAGELANLAHCYPDRTLVVVNEGLLIYTDTILDLYTKQYGPMPSRWLLGLHVYGTHSPEIAMSKAKSQLEEGFRLARKYDLAGIWVTEYGYTPCWSSMEDSAAFVSEFTDWALNRGVQRLAPFQLWMEDTEPWAFGEECSTKLVNDDSTLTLIGEAYRGK